MKLFITIVAVLLTNFINAQTITVKGSVEQTHFQSQVQQQSQNYKGSGHWVTDKYANCSIAIINLGSTGLFSQADFKAGKYNATNGKTDSNGEFKLTIKAKKGDIIIVIYDNDETEYKKKKIEGNELNTGKYIIKYKK